jgi:hypothetical protein
MCHHKAVLSHIILKLMCCELILCELKSQDTPYTLFPGPASLLPSDLDSRPLAPATLSDLHTSHEGHYARLAQTVDLFDQVSTISCMCESKDKLQALSALRDQSMAYFDVLSRETNPALPALCGSVALCGRLLLLIHNMVLDLVEACLAMGGNPSVESGFHQYKIKSVVGIATVSRMINISIRRCEEQNERDTVVACGIYHARAARASTQRIRILSSGLDHPSEEENAFEVLEGRYFSLWAL